MQAERVQGTAAALAELDVLCSFAYVAYEYGDASSELTDARLTRIVGGRHPVVERVVGQENFIRNDTLLDGAERCFAILTGPNMGGKSTSNT